MVFLNTIHAFLLEGVSEPRLLLGLPLPPAGDMEHLSRQALLNSTGLLNLNLRPNVTDIKAQVLNRIPTYTQRVVAEIPFTLLVCFLNVWLTARALWQICGFCTEKFFNPKTAMFGHPPRLHRLAKGMLETNMNIFEVVG